MTDEERQIVEALLRDLIRLTRPSGSAPPEEGPLAADEIESLLAGVKERQIVRSPDDQDAPALPEQLD